MLQTEEQKKVARIVNALIDIPLVPEEMEQTVFEHAVSVVDQALDNVLPAAFADLLRNVEQGIDKDHAAEFSRRLVACAHFLRFITRRRRAAVTSAAVIF